MSIELPSTKATGFKEHVSFEILYYVQYKTISLYELQRFVRFYQVPTRELQRSKV